MQFAKVVFHSLIFLLISNMPLLANKEKDTLDSNIGGIKFHSLEVHAKERTSISLFPNYFNIKSSFSIAFDCEIYNVRSFGYIFRLIEKKENDDKPIFYLLQTPNILQPQSYKLELYTSGNKSNVQFLIPVEKQNRLRINIYYLADKQELKIHCNGTEKTINGINLNKVRSNIIFGSYGFENEDVASMSIRNIRIQKEGRTIHFWPLNEFKGDVAKDNVAGIESVVKNPIWLRNEHFYWNKLRSFECDAMAGVVFKEKKQQFYFINKASLQIFTPSSDNFEVLEYKNQRPFSRNQHFSIYDESKDKIISYDFKFLKSPPGKKTYSILNEESMEWSNVDETTDHLNNHLHNLYWNKDGSITIFAGYSDYTYFNDFNTFDFSKNAWRAINVVGDTIYPRAETAIAKDDETNMLYIFGGFGNKEGKQVYGGKIYKDLYSVDLTKNYAEKLMNWENLDLDLVPKGGLIFSNEKSTFYTLMGETSDESFLRLYRINFLDKTVYSVSDSIPLYFGRMESNVYLFKDDLAQYLYCICRECKNSDKSLVSVYRIKFPPSDLGGNVDTGLPYYIYMVVFSTLFIGGLGIFTFLGQKKRKSSKMNTPEKSLVSSKRQDEEKSSVVLRKNENAIWFLGEFRLFNAKGKDITHLLPKKLKELFLLVFFKTLYSDGISTNDLSETLWPGMEKVSQKNNRGVTINGVRKVLEEFQGIKLINVEGSWKIEWNDNCYFDFMEAENMVRNKVFLSNPEMFISLFSFGNILPGIQFEWLDTIKASYENDVLSCLYELCEYCIKKEEYLICLDISTLIFEKYDPLDELSLRFKLIALHKLKGYSKAQNEFDLFRKRYFKTYQQEYKLSFGEVMQPGYKS